MKKFMLLATGGAIGYVLGARAGRPAYDRIVRGWTRASRAMGLREVGRSVGQSAVDLRDAAKQRAASQVEDLMDRATDAVAPGSSTGDAPKNGNETHPTTEVRHQTVVAPTSSS